MWKIVLVFFICVVMVDVLFVYLGLGVVDEGYVVGYVEFGVVGL